MDLRPHHFVPSYRTAVHVLYGAGAYRQLTFFRFSSEESPEDRQLARAGPRSSYSGSEIRQV
jgi:hypothetical protein